MKAVRCILKIVAALAAVAAVVCLVRNYWDTIEDLFYTAVGKIKEKKAQRACSCPGASEYADYADGEMQ